MQAQQDKCTNGKAIAIGTALPAFQTQRVILNVRQFSQRNPVFTESALRNLIFKADERLGANGTIAGNGLIEAGALIRIGRKVLIDEDCFFEWMEAQNKRGAA